MPLHLPLETPTHQVEKYIYRQSDGVNLNTSLAQLEQRKKADEDDFRVPIYIHSRISQSHDKMQKNFDAKKLNSVGSRYYECSAEVQTNSGRNPKRIGSQHLNMRKAERSDSERLPKLCPSEEQPLKSLRNLSNGEIIDNIVRQTEVTLDQEYQDCSVANLGRLHQSDACLQLDPGTGLQSNDTVHCDGLVESTRDTEEQNVLLPRGCFHTTVDQSSPIEAINDTEYHDTGTASPIHKGNLKKQGNISKISRVDNLTTLKISPDDVVGIIGQKHFWKARRAIVK